MHIDVIHGPNLDRLGTREPAHYGHVTLDELNGRLERLGASLGATVTCFQSNHEGALIERLHAVGPDAFILNAAGYTHTSVALRDAVLCTERPVIEVHLSNIHQREVFRHRSLLADVVRGQIIGLGPTGYELALRALVAAAPPG